MSKRNSGWAMHCHHTQLIEWCWDYDERWSFIKKYKPLNEQEIRLRVFALLPPEAVAELPEKLLNAWKKMMAAREKNIADWEKNMAAREKNMADWEKWDKIYAAGKKMMAAWEKNIADWEKWDKIYAAWERTKGKQFHDKWCGCKEWNGKELIFTKEAGNE